MLNLAEQRGIGGIEAQLNGMQGITELHHTIGEAEPLMGGNKKRHSLAVVDRLLAEGDTLVLCASVGS